MPSPQDATVQVWQPAGPTRPTRLENQVGFAPEGARKQTMKTYKQGYGSSGTASVNDYPGIACAILHVKC